MCKTENPFEVFSGRTSLYFALIELWTQARIDGRRKIVARLLSTDRVAELQGILNRTWLD